MALPVAAIVCIVLACWVLLVLILFGVYQLFKSRGTCDCQCAPCGKEESGGCCECCITLSDSCNCCSPSVNGCLDKVCPGKKKVSCVDLLLCQCCASEGEDSCCMKVLRRCKCRCFESDCCSSCRDCEGVVCCCLEIRLVSNKSIQNRENHDQQRQPVRTPKKYLTQPSTQRSIELSTDQTSSKPLTASKTRSVKTESPRALPASPPASARSTSQLILVPKKATTQAKGAKKVVAKKFAKSQSLDLPKPSTATKGSSIVQQLDNKGPKRRSLPNTPRDQNNSQTMRSPKKSKRSDKENETSSELREVEVRQNSIPVHTLNSHSVARAMSQGSLQSGSHVSFTLSDISDSQSGANSSYILIPAGYDVHSASSGFVSQGDYSLGNQMIDGTSMTDVRESTLKSNTGPLSKRPLPIPSGR